MAFATLNSGFSAARRYLDWISPKTLDEIHDGTKRRRMLMAILDKYGSVKSGMTAVTHYLPIETTMEDLQVYQDGNRVNFDPIDALDHLTFNPVQYRMGTSFTETEMTIALDINPKALQDLLKRKVEKLKESAMKRFDYKLMNDHGANPKDVVGLTTAKKYTQCTAADRIALPNGSVGGISTALGTYGGETPIENASKTQFFNDTLQTAGIPFPYGMPEEYDVTSPLLVNIASTDWEAGNAWENNCEQALRWTVNTQRIRCDTSASDTSVAMLGANLFTPLQDKLSTKDRYTTTAHPEMQAMGFTGDNFQFEGAIVGTDHTTPANDGYITDPTKVAVHHRGKKLFEKGRDAYDPYYEQELMKIAGMVEVRYVPKDLAILSDFTVAP